MRGDAKFVPGNPDISTMTEMEMYKNQKKTMSGKVLIIEAKNLSGGQRDIVAPKS